MSAVFPRIGSTVVVQRREDREQKSVVVDQYASDNWIVGQCGDVVISFRLADIVHDIEKAPTAGAPPSMIDHPKHYGGDTIYEAIKVITAWGLGFNLGNTVKYISRAGKKNVEGAERLSDLKKARWYLDYEIKGLEQGWPSERIEAEHNKE